MTPRLHPGLAPIDAVAFDLDGTLIDSAADIQHALNAALKKAGLERFDLDIVRSWIGDGPDALLAQALARLGRADADADLRTRLRRWYDIASLAAPLSLGQVYPGIPALLMALRRHLPLAVATNKPTPLARAVLEAAGLLPLLRGVFGADSAAQRKPAPPLLLATARALGVAQTRLAMVGDSALDVQAAEAAGCPALLVGWGYGAHLLAGRTAVLRVDSAAALLDTLLAARTAAATTTTHD